MSVPKSYRSPDIVTVFKLSPVNGAQYNGELLPPQHWDWPQSTWLKQRMAQIDEFRPMKTPQSVMDAAARKIRSSMLNG
jgi:hypothetical protein